MKPKVKPFLAIISVRCLVCGRWFLVKIYPDGRYIGGCYFGVINYPEYGIRNEEYWECEKCCEDDEDD